MINRERKRVGGFLTEACYLWWNAPKAWETTAPNSLRLGMSAFVLDTKWRRGAELGSELRALWKYWPPLGRLRVCIQPHESWSGGGWQVGWWGTASCIAMGLTQAVRESVCRRVRLLLRWRGGQRVGIGVAAETRRPVVLASDWYWVSNAHRHMRWKLNATPSRYLDPVLVNSRQPPVLAPHNSLWINWRTQIQILGNSV